jgi:hypothetical protein
MNVIALNLQHNPQDITQVEFLDSPWEVTNPSGTISVTEAEELLNGLEFSPDIQVVIMDIFTSILEKDSNIEVSMTGDGEFLIFKNLSKDNWINLLIDEDGDAEIIRIFRQRKKTFNEHYYFGSYTIDDLVKRFNELQ